MKGLQFLRLVLISDSKKLANQFEFPKRLNLITGKDNSIGKSTLVKNLFWTLGCEPNFDEEWKSNDIKAILYFKVDHSNFIVSRYKDTIYFGEIGSKLKKYNSISGEYAKKFASIVNFNLILPNRSDELECPPPAYYFLPFYIDQKKSWGEPWNSFENLGQFADWKRTLIKYFTGYIKPEHFELEEDIYEEKAIQKEADKQVERINSAIEVIEESSNEESIALSEDEFNRIQDEITHELEIFTERQTILFDTQVQLKFDIYDLEKQKDIALSSSSELERDYEFSVEYIPEDILECPLCGVKHDNSLLNRATFLAEKSSLEEQAEIIKSLLEDKYKNLQEINSKLTLVRNEIDRINKKYIIDEVNPEDNNRSFEKVLHSIAQHNISKSVTKSKESQEVKSKQANDEQRKLKKQQSKLLTKSEKTELDELFIGSLIENIEILSAQGVNLNGVGNPINYKKLLGGGAAESTRGILAYHLAILSQIAHVNNSSIAPFVIDTPNQQEQASHRYQKVLDTIKDNISNGFQIILCGMESESLKTFKKEAHVITLNEKKLLTETLYQKLRLEYEETILVQQ